MNSHVTFYIVLTDLVALQFVCFCVFFFCFWLVLHELDSFMKIFFLPGILVSTDLFAPQKRPCLYFIFFLKHLL